MSSLVRSLEALTLTISAGPNDNRRLISARGRLIAPNEYRNWKVSAFNEIIAQLPRGWKPLEPTEEDQLPYTIKVFIPSRRVDHTNYLKCVQDALVESGVFVDDRWVVPRFEPCELDKKNPRIIITLEYETSRERGSLDNR